MVVDYLSREMWWTLQSPDRHRHFVVLAVCGFGIKTPTQEDNFNESIQSLNSSRQFKIINAMNDNRKQFPQSGICSQHNSTFQFKKKFNTSYFTHSPVHMLTLKPISYVYLPVKRFNKT